MNQPIVCPEFTPVNFVKNYRKGLLANEKGGTLPLNEYISNIRVHNESKLGAQNSAADFAV